MLTTSHINTNTVKYAVLTLFAKRNEGTGVSFDNITFSLMSFSHCTAIVKHGRKKKHT
jgi:hypothetical protein